MYCSESSLAQSEPIVGTAAANTRIWLAFEHRGGWGRDVPSTAGIPEILREQLAAWAKAMPELRVQLIRRPGQRGGPLTVFVGVSEPGGGRVGSFTCENLEALAELRLADAVQTLRAGQLPAGCSAVDAPLLLVCAHGKRDRCCAKLGLPIYERAAARTDVVAWQTSHLGGHRFAATLVLLPQGVCYGRVLPDETDALLDAHLAGNIFALDRLRGQMWQSTPAQAAEHLLREHLGHQLQLGAVVAGSSQEVEGGYAVSVEALGQKYHVQVKRQAIGGQAPPSCDKAPRQVTGFVALEIRACSETSSSSPA